MLDPIEIETKLRPKPSKLAPSSRIPVNAPVAVYLRKSRLDESSSAEETLIHHKNEIDAYIAREGFTNVETYFEVASGETIAERYEMQRLLNDVEAGKFRAVITVAIDRLSRGSQLDNHILSSTMRKANCVVLTTKGRTVDFANEESAMFNEFEFMIARNELRIIKQRLRKGRINSAKAGNAMVPNPPLGYVRRDKQLHIEESEAKIYHHIVGEYLEGKSFYKIARDLNRNGIPTPKGAKWTSYGLRIILQNPIYAGFVRFNHKRVTEDGKLVENKPEDVIIAQGKHDALIDIETFEKIQRMIEKNSHKKGNERQSDRYPLSSICKCAECGQTLSVRFVEQKTLEYNYIGACNRLSKDGYTRCKGTKGIKEHIVLDVLKKEMDQYSEALFAPLESESHPTVNELSETDPIERQRTIIRDNESKLSKLKFLYLEGDFSEAEYVKMKNESNDAIREAIDEIERLEASPDSVINERRDRWVGFDIDSMFDGSMKPSEVNHAIRTLVDSIIIKKTTESIHIQIVFK